MTNFIENSLDRYNRGINNEGGTTRPLDLLSSVFPDRSNGVGKLDKLSLVADEIKVGFQQFLSFIRANGTPLGRGLHVVQTPEGTSVFSLNRFVLFHTSYNIYDGFTGEEYKTVDEYQGSREPFTDCPLLPYPPHVFIPTHFKNPEDAVREINKRKHLYLGSTHDMRYRDREGTWSMVFAASEKAPLLYKLPQFDEYADTDEELYIVQDRLCPFPIHASMMARVAREFDFHVAVPFIATTEVLVQERVNVQGKRMKVGDDTGALDNVPASLREKILKVGKYIKGTTPFYPDIEFYFSPSTKNYCAFEVING